MSTPNLPGAEIRESGIELERVIFFSDAIYAIAITLLSMQIGFPQIPLAELDARLGKTVIGMIPRFLLFAQTYLIIAVYWIGHHRSFSYIKRYDGTLLALNLLHLLFIAFLPVPAALLGQYSSHQVSINFYAANMILAGLSQWLMWRNATHKHRLVAPDLDSGVIRLVSARLWITIAVLLLAIVAAFFSTGIAIIIPIVFFVLYVPFEGVFQRILWQALAPRAGTAGP